MSDHYLHAARPLRAALWTNLLYMVILPIVIYHFASPHMSVIAALLLSALPPVLRTVFGLLKYGRFNLFGLLSLLSIAVKLLTGVLFQNPRLVLVSDSLLTGVHGILLLGSLLFGKSLLQILASNMLATSPSAQSEQLLRRWQEPQHHAFFTRLTALVGAGLLLELVVRFSLAFTLTVEQFLVIGPLVRYGLFGVILLGVWFSSQRRLRLSNAQEQVQLPQDTFHTPV